MAQGDPDNSSGRKPRAPRRRTLSHRFDDAIAERIVNHLKRGAFIETAAAAVGIAKETFYNWLRLGNELNPATDEPIHPRLAKFVTDVEEAQAYFETSMHALIGKAAVGDPKLGQPGQWTAAAWLLERKLPQRWGRREHIEHSGPGGGPIETATSRIRGMTSEQKRVRAAALLKKAGIKVEEPAAPPAPPDETK